MIDSTPWLLREDKDPYRKDREKAEFYRTLPPESLARHVKAVCRGAAKMAACREDADSVRAWEDPLPPESIETLNRLRRKYRHDHA